MLQILTLDENALSKASSSLYQMVERSGFAPTHIVGIATGGLVVARQILDAVGHDLPLIEVTLSRPGTQTKKRRGVARFLCTLPYAVTDRLRVIEAELLNLAASRKKESVLEPLPASAIEALRFIPATPETRVLVVDDAVDSGTTLARTLMGLRSAISSGAAVRTAVITVTRPRPIVSPDYALFGGLICRFPWSHDFKS